MKKYVSLLFTVALTLALASCGIAPAEETGGETTAIAYTGMEGGFYVYEKEWNDYISGKRDDYQVLAESMPATTPMETTAEPYQALNALAMVPEVLIELADGSCHAPYASLVCAQTCDGAVADGRLILQSTENVLLAWVKEGLIPHIELSDRLTLWCGDEPLTDTHTFVFYTKHGDTFAEAARLEDATASECYRYGAEHFSGMSVYVRFDMSRISEHGNARYAYIFSAEFVSK